MIARVLRYLATRRRRRLGLSAAGGRGYRGVGLGAVACAEDVPPPTSEFEDLNHHGLSYDAPEQRRNFTIREEPRNFTIREEQSTRAFIEFFWPEKRNIAVFLENCATEKSGEE